MKRKQIENFRLYFRFFKKKGVPRFPPGEIGKLSAMECFSRFDSKGVILPCRHPRTLARVLSGKAQLNLNISLWAAGLEEGTLFGLELMEWFPYFPNWVWKACQNQANKIRKRKKERKWKS